MLAESSWVGQRMSYFKAVNETSGIVCRKSDETPLLRGLSQRLMYQKIICGLVASLRDCGVSFRVNEALEAI